MNTCKYTSNSCTLSKADSILYGRNVDIQYLNDNTYLAQRLDTFDFTTCKITKFNNDLFCVVSFYEDSPKVKKYT